MASFVFDHVGLSVADLDAQRDFYAVALDMTHVEEEFTMAEARIRTAILRNPDGLKIELIERGGSSSQRFDDPFDGADTQGYFHWAMDVENLDAAFAHPRGRRNRSLSARARRPRRCPFCICQGP